MTVKIQELDEVKYREYRLQLEPEDEALLLEIGRVNIVNDDQKCIDYAIQKIIEQTNLHSIYCRPPELQFG